MKKILIVLILLSGCTDAAKGKLVSLNTPAEVKCYSGGILIYTGETTGKISNEAHSDGYYFKDKLSGDFIEINANCIFRRK